MNKNNLFQTIHADIYHERNLPLIEGARHILAKHDQRIVCEFYSALSESQGCERYLTSDLIEKRLKRSLQEWLLSLFDLSANREYSCYAGRQSVIGEVHARVKIPMQFIEYSVDYLKQQFFVIVFEENREDQDTMMLLNFIQRAIDLAVMVFNDVYLENSIHQEKIQQNLRHYYINHNMAIEFEQSRANLLHWYREIVTLLYHHYSQVKSQHIVPLRQSKFGLWVEHRACLLFYNQTEVLKFQRKLDEIDSTLNTVIRMSRQENWEALADEIDKMNSLITSADWLLEQVAREIVALENNKDCLTRLFTRRYLPNVIQHEINYCLEHGTQLGVIMIDIDHFKSINDHYGHSTGDTVLNQTANLLSVSLRAYDYIFRYGGEEFLVIVNNTDELCCMTIAENLRKKVEQNSFSDTPIIKKPITVSMGVAIFDRHPDYEQLIDHADKALYRAKENGRNRVELYHPELETSGEGVH